MTEEDKTLDRHVQLALGASIEAVGDANLDPETIDRERAGVYIGSTNSAPETFEGVWEPATNRGAESMVGKELPAAFYYGLLANAAPASIAIRYGFMGPSLVSDACSSGMNAIEQARHAIRDGFCDVALAGEDRCLCDADGPLLLLHARRGQQAQRGSRKGASRPFDRDRDGFVLSARAPPWSCSRSSSTRRSGAPALRRGGAGVATNTNAYHTPPRRPVASPSPLS